MFHKILGIISFIANKNICTKESNLYLSSIRYIGEELKKSFGKEKSYPCDMFEITIKNTGNYNLENIFLSKFETNQNVHSFTISAGESYTLTIFFPKNWISEYHGTHELFVYTITLPFRKRKQFCQDLSITCTMDKKCYIASYGKRHDFFE